MKQIQIKQLLIVLGLIVGVGIMFTPVKAGAVDVYQACSGIAAGASSTVCNSKTNTAGSFVAPIINTVLFLLGGVSVIVIIIAGLSYVTSAGDSARVKTAKDTLLYAIIGLVVAILAFSIVNYVLKVFVKK